MSSLFGTFLLAALKHDIVTRPSWSALFTAAALSAAGHHWLKYYKIRVKPVLYTWCLKTYRCIFLWDIWLYQQCSNLLFLSCPLSGSDKLRKNQLVGWQLRVPVSFVHKLDVPVWLVTLSEQERPPKWKNSTLSWHPMTPNPLLCLLLSFFYLKVLCETFGVSLQLPEVPLYSLYPD